MQALHQLEVGQVSCVVEILESSSRRRGGQVIGGM